MGQAQWEGPALPARGDLAVSQTAMVAEEGAIRQGLSGDRSWALGYPCADSRASCGGVTSSPSLLAERIKTGEQAASAPLPSPESWAALAGASLSGCRENNPRTLTWLPGSGSSGFIGVYLRTIKYAHGSLGGCDVCLHPRNPDTELSPKRPFLGDPHKRPRLSLRLGMGWASSWLCARGPCWSSGDHVGARSWVTPGGASPRAFSGSRFVLGV